MASSTADVVSSITVDGESTNHVELDWGDSVRLNISVPTDPAYANIVPHIVSPDIHNLENSYATTFGLDTDGDFVVDQSFGMQLNGQGHMQLAGASSGCQ